MLILAIQWASTHIWRRPAAPHFHFGRHPGWKALLVAISVYAIATEFAVAQAPQRPAKVGILWYLDSGQAAPFVGAFKDGLRELGWIEGRTVVFVERYDQGDQSRFPKMAAELVALKVDVLFVADAAAPAALQATAQIPIVCADFFDAVAQKITASLARPQGNVTGVSWQSVESAIKRLQ